MKEKTTINRQQRYNYFIIEKKECQINLGSIISKVPALRDQKYHVK